jgi:membrane protease YdiL (CAAX protease family)
VENTEAALPLESPVPPPVAVARMPAWFALGQVILISGIPTQIVVAVLFIVGFGWYPVDGNYEEFMRKITSLEFIATTMLVDTALIALLIRLFLELSGEDSRAVFVGTKRPLGEIVRGLALVPVILVGVALLVVAIRYVAPGLHTVEESPIQAYMQTPFEACIFLVVVVLGGGIKEELQRAFVLHRFDQALGGIRLGLVLFSIMFGVLHYDQGWDVAIAIGTLGAFWGVMYIRRRSAVMNMVSHAGFNAANVAQVLIARLLGQ